MFEPSIETATQTIEFSEKLGSLQPVVGFVGSVALAVSLILQAVVGRALIYPNLNDRKITVRLFAALSIAGMVFLIWAENGESASEFDLPSIALYCLVTGIAGILIYFLIARHFLLEPMGWHQAQTIVTGPWLTDKARKYNVKRRLDRATLLSAFGNTPEAVRLVWPPSSTSIGWALIFISTAAFNIGIPGAIAAMTFDMFDVRVQTEQTAETKILRFPSHFVFATGKYDIADLDTSALANELQGIAEFGPTRVEVHGHADGEGEPADNQILSERRAETVEAWLEKQPELEGIDVTSKGFGESKMRFDENGLEGKALRDARRGNRRVELLLYK